MLVRRVMVLSSMPMEVVVVVFRATRTSYLVQVLALVTNHPPNRWNRPKHQPAHPRLGNIGHACYTVLPVCAEFVEIRQAAPRLRIDAAARPHRGQAVVSFPQLTILRRRAAISSHRILCDFTARQLPQC